MVLRCIGPVFNFSGKQQLYGKNEQQTNTGWSQDFNNEVKKSPKLQPFQKGKINMV